MQSHVTTTDHPLIQHKLTLLRDKRTSTIVFRQLTREIATLLCYEVTRDLELDNVDIETPLTAMRAPKLAGKKLVFAPVLRAGMGFLEGMLDLVPSARVAHVGLYRDPATLEAVEYYFRSPADVSSRLVIAVDPMIWVPEERLYVRVEDTIAVTPHGIENLTGFVPRSIDDVERTMAEPGLLQAWTSRT